MATSMIFLSSISIPFSTIIQSTWTQLLIYGSIPSPRSGHKIVVTQKGKIVLFGGYTEDGYSNDVFFLDIANKRWEKPMLSGKPPTPREAFAMTEVRNQIWVIGGYSLGTYNDDLIVLDLDQETWLWAQTTGPKPNGRQGLEVANIGKRLVIFGGCNFKKEECYKDTFILHTETLVFSAVDQLSAKDLPEREGLSLISYGKLVIGFGGCKLAEKCFGDLFVFHVDMKCYEYCTSNGKCENEACVCNAGFRLDDCSYSNQCGSNDCFGHGVCGQSDRCECYPGFEGKECGTVIETCKSNCTSADNGVCRKKACVCFDPWTGEDCSTDSRIKKCPADCSGHGKCDTSTGICECEKGWQNADCGKEEEKKVENPFSLISGGAKKPPPPPPKPAENTNSTSSTSSTGSTNSTGSTSSQTQTPTGGSQNQTDSSTKPSEGGSQGSNGTSGSGSGESGTQADKGGDNSSGTAPTTSTQGSTNTTTESSGTAITPTSTSENQSEEKAKKVAAEKPAVQKITISKNSSPKKSTSSSKKGTSPEELEEAEENDHTLRYHNASRPNTQHIPVSDLKKDKRRKGDDSLHLQPISKWRFEVSKGQC